ncbi:MAG: hypothetical protein E4H26_04375 [Flavobacteriales bacterium]|nr:MAG: hypothetical protein E4H26_04375 [Flavobacteriales bacterium]
MKKYLKHATYLVLTVMALAFTACQDEFEKVDTVNEQETLLANSATAQLMERTVSNDGSIDNIVDGSSCFNIRFPYTVKVNGAEITINALPDLDKIEAVFDAIDGDEDLLDIIFPITVTLADFTDITLTGIEDLHQLAEQCIEDGQDDDIECIDFVYPIKLFTFDANLQKTGNVIVESDKDLRRFFAGLDGTDLVSIEFPIALELYDGSEIRVSSNAELADAIERAKNECDEDDDNDYNDDDFTKERLDNLLVECPWLITAVDRDNMSQIDQYREWLMNFSKDGSVTVLDRMGNSLTGTWNTRVTDWRVALTLEFDGVVDFNLEWFVYEIAPGKIKLFSGEGNKIIMENVCGIIDQDPNTLRNILKECSWVIKKVKVGGEEIGRLLGFEFKFMAEGVVTLSNGELTSQGTWEIALNAQGRLVMAIVMGEEPGVSFEWPLSELRNDRLKFEIEGTDYELILERVCNDNMDDGDVLAIRNILMGGDWRVANYTGGEAGTTDFTAYTFNFQGANVVAVTAGQTGPTLLAHWRVLRNSDGKLNVYLNFGDQSPLGELTDDWDLFEIASNRLALKDLSGGNDSLRTLVFEKP